MSDFSVIDDSKRYTIVYFRNRHHRDDTLPCEDTKLFMTHNIIFHKTIWVNVNVFPEYMIAYVMVKIGGYD